MAVWGFCHITRTLEVSLWLCWWRKPRCLGTKDILRYFILNTHTRCPPSAPHPTCLTSPNLAHLVRLLTTPGAVFFFVRSLSSSSISSWGKTPSCRAQLPKPAAPRRLRHQETLHISPLKVPLRRWRGTAKRKKWTRRQMRRPKELLWVRMPVLNQRGCVGESHWAHELINGNLWLLTGYKYR